VTAGNLTPPTRRKAEKVQFLKILANLVEVGVYANWKLLSSVSRQHACTVGLSAND